jgi:(p)ppGpp synthase/HD superfamily hydrolase
MLTERFNQALLYAAQVHKNQVRKGSGVPYIAHLLGVTALVLEDGGDEDQAISALLHDAVEDQGGLETLAEIRRRFGERVARIVDGCTDAYELPKPPWRARKEGYLRRLYTEAPDVYRVSLADKLHNARSLLMNLSTGDPDVWDKFNGGKDGTLWYYRALVETFRKLTSGFMLDEFERTVTEIENFS